MTDSKILRALAEAYFDLTQANQDATCCCDWETVYVIQCKLAFLNDFFFAYLGDCEPPAEMYADWKSYKDASEGRNNE